MNHQALKRLSSMLEADSVDAFFGWSESTLGYLFGLFENAHHRFLALGVNSKGDVVLICPALSASQAKRAGIRDVRPWEDGEDPLQLFQGLAEEWDLRSAVIELDEMMPAQMVLKLQAALPAALFRNGGPTLATIRRSKSDAEIALLRKAASIADAAYQDVKPLIKAGQTELQIQSLLYQAMSARGGNPNFAIIGAGPNGAEPHHSNDSTIVKKGDVLILDFGCDVEGYRSDITRTVAVGTPSSEAKDIYKIVYEAHYAGQKAIRLGVATGEADKAARSTIEAAGYGPQFMHRLGHGIGIQEHEQPYLLPKSLIPFEANDCFSIEPGIYLEGKFGCRLENIYTVNETGAVSLNEPIPPEIEVVDSDLSELTAPS